MKNVFVGLILAVLLLGAFACSSAAPVPAPAAPAAPGGKAAAPALTTTAAPAPRPTTAPSAVDQAGGSETDRMIVRTGSLTVLVEDVPGTIDKIARLAEDMRGFVVTSSSGKDSQQRLIGTISIRVPAERFADAVKAVRDLAVEVTSETSSSQDVTQEYTDLSSRLRNLEASEQQLLSLMAKATKIEDILAIQKELTNVRGQIEQTKGRML